MGMWAKGCGHFHWQATPRPVCSWLPSFLWQLLIGCKQGAWHVTGSCTKPSWVLIQESLWPFHSDHSVLGLKQRLWAPTLVHGEARVVQSLAPINLTTSQDLISFKKMEVYTSSALFSTFLLFLIFLDVKQKQNLSFCFLGVIVQLLNSEKTNMTHQKRLYPHMWNLLYMKKTIRKRKFFGKSENKNS